MGRVRHAVRRSAVVERAYVEGDRDVELRVEVEAAEVQLIVAAVERPELEYRVRVSPLGDPTCVADGEPARWPLWRGLPLACNYRDPFVQATRWAHRWLFHEGLSSSGDPKQRRRCMQQVYDVCRRAAMLAADRCDPMARAIAMRFVPHVRWFVYRQLVLDRSGRVAQLAATCPGALVLAYGCEEQGVEPDQGSAARSVIADAVAGLRLNALLARAVDAWLYAIQTRCALVEHRDLPLRPVRDGMRSAADVAAAQRLLVRRACALVPTETLWIPPPAGFVPEDIPAGARDRAAWYRVLKACPYITARWNHEDGMRDLAAFVSLHGVALYRAAKRRRRSPLGLLMMIDDAVSVGHVRVNRRSAVDNVLAEAERWHAMIYTTCPECDPATPFPAPPVSHWQDDDFEARALLTVGELEAEGRAMQNCVVSRAAHALSGERAYYSITHGRRRATLEITLDDHGWTITEAAGRANSKLPGPTWWAIARFVAALKRDDLEGGLEPDTPSELCDSIGLGKARTLPALLAAFP